MKKPRISARLLLLLTRGATARKGAFFKTNDPEEAVNLPLLEKIKLLDQLGEEEREALLKVIEMAVANKKLKDNLSSLLDG